MADPGIGDSGWWGGVKNICECFDHILKFALKINLDQVREKLEDIKRLVHKKSLVRGR